MDCQKCAYSSGLPYIFPEKIYSAPAPMTLFTGSLINDLFAGFINAAVVTLFSTLTDGVYGNWRFIPVEGRNWFMDIILSTVGGWLGLRIAAPMLSGE